MKIKNATISNSLRSILRRIEANASSYEIELLFNRAKGKTVDTTFEASGDITRFKTISPTCEQCKSNLLESLKELFSAQQQINVTEPEIEDLAFLGFYLDFVQYEYRWFEGPGYYGQFADDSVTPPRNELKQMMEANLKYFGANRNYSEMVYEYQSGYSYNEWAIDAEGMKRLEEDRTLFSTESSDSLNFEGYDSEGTCGAAIKALVLICGDQQDDPFYYGKPGQCLDFAEVYKKNYGSADTPPVVYMNRKNLTHPFSSTCDIEISCGVEKIGNESKTDAADVQVNEEEDASTNDTLSAASTNLVLLSGCGYLVSSLLALFYM